MDHLKRPEIRIRIKGSMTKNIIDILNYPEISYSLPEREKNIAVSETGIITKINESKNKGFLGYSLDANFQDYCFQSR